ncbi:disulfide bond formation protein B [Psychromarinibacter sp. C21-152]|uniref:Disulfide bond formation protein B n=1 Tax=Psychromarinibacter sediminicola TaxID=3033385 RepID=A0AAE3NWW7_9RHOB|nr:disulfide bond formation protein B [Psychromarinibacter sediminicola]MDF0603627.1 disulfide bond formation protein B [Psychromarinibacter sediminicola]
MTRNMLILIAAGGSAALLLGAWGSQYIGGLQPCEMCIWQRWPHGAAVLIGVAALLLPWAILPLLGALSAAITGGIGVYHTGVERGWWEGITECSGTGGLSNLSADDLINPNIEAGPPLIRCDEVQFEFLTLSMASWNALISFGLALIWLMAWRATRPR